MGYKSAVGGIIGKTIKGVVIKERRDSHTGSPKSQIFLLFHDNTSYEFWSVDDIHTTGGVDARDVAGVRKYMSDVMDTVLEFYVDPD